MTAAAASGRSAGTWRARRSPCGPSMATAAPEDRPDGGRQRVEPVAAQREPGEVALEVLGLPVELRPLVDEEADDAALERDRVRRSTRRTVRPASTASGPTAPGLAAAAAVARGLALIGHRAGRRRGSGRAPAPRRGRGPRSCPAASQRPAGRRDDREVARLERIEGGGAGPSGPGPSRPRGRPVAGQARRAEHPGVREQRLAGGRRARPRRPPSLGRPADGHEVVQQPPELALDVDVAIGAPDEAELAVRRRAAPRRAGAGSRR